MDDGWPMRTLDAAGLAEHSAGWPFQGEPWPARSPETPLIAAEGAAELDAAGTWPLRALA